MAPRSSRRLLEQQKGRTRESEREAAKAAYDKARVAYRKILAESKVD